MKYVLYCMLWLLVVFPIIAGAGEPTETLKSPIDQVIAVLNDPQYQTDEQKKVQRDKLWHIISPVFDYAYIAKSALGRFHWQNTFSKEQREEFTDVFAKFLGNIYLDRIQEGYQNETVVFIEEEIFNPAKAMVKTSITRGKTVIPIDYRMRAEKGVWKIYDINIEGVSLVQNYRSQFRSILLNGTASQLIDQLKSKTK